MTSSIKYNATQAAVWDLNCWSLQLKSTIANEPGRECLHWRLLKKLKYKDLYGKYLLN